MKIELLVSPVRRYTGDFIFKKLTPLKFFFVFFRELYSSMTGDDVCTRNGLLAPLFLPGIAYVENASTQFEYCILRHLT